MAQSTIECTCGAIFSTEMINMDGQICPSCQDAWIEFSEGQKRSLIDPHGAYNHAGDYLGKATGRCEDAPCCGCC